MKKIKLSIAIFAVSVLGIFALVAPSPVLAIDPLGSACTNNSSDPICKAKNDDAGKYVKNIVNTLLFIVGILSVIMIIWSGIQYTTSSGDSGRVAKAKNTLMYSIIGLVIAFLAFAIVNWVMNIFK